MDRVRNNLRDAIDRRGTNMATVSRHAGKNHAYISQFMEGTPRKLPEDVREKVARFLEIDESMLKDSPHAGNVLDSNGAGARHSEAETTKGEVLMTITSLIRALIEEHGVEAVTKAIARATRAERATDSPLDRQRTL